MTIAEDASQPSPIHITSTSGATASFSPPANSLLVALLAADGPATTTAAVGTISDSGSHSWTNVVRQNNHAAGVDAIGGTCEVWICQLSSAPGSITVSASWTGASNGGNLTVRVLTGAASSQAGAATAGSGGNGTNTVNPTVTLTPTVVGSHVYGAALDYTTNATLTANANTTSIDQFPDSTNGDTWTTWKGAADTTTLTSTTFGFTNAAAVYQLAAAEILPASTTAPAYPFSLVHRGRTAVPVRARRQASTPVRAQVNPPYQFQPVHRTRQVLGRLRGRVALFAPPQVVVQPPAYPVPAVHRLRQVLGRIRGRSATPTPPQQTLPVGAWVPLAHTPKRVSAQVRRPRMATPPPAQAPVPPPSSHPRRPLFAVKRRQATPVPAQVVIVPPAYPPQPVYKRLLAFVTRRGRATTAPLVGLAPNLCVTPRPNGGTTTRPGSGVTAYNTATTSRPNTGVTTRPNTGTTQDPC